MYTKLTIGMVIMVVVACSGAAFGQGAGAPSKADEGKEMKVVGCVQWEKDYRQARNEGRGGVLGTGAGVGNEFVLTFAQVEGAGGRTAAASVGTGGKKISEGTAFSITGDREKELGRRVGQQIEVIGILEERGERNSERAGDLPRIRMTAWVWLKESCPE